ncbi:SRPBCC family protein [Nocardioides sp. cx-173]|uniref:SRPBCC family protein n=1 Tax=Nocardioides sp. cx-173 TaxID=2898796 RepID=UPI001E5C19AF|nr:SRPBCC family protein [Nocardioides sp. cx-173]MCD4525534.1 SRPBCC family protein [Nocardioides sp. cx-173]UGB42678.1 SRPBCC family protein [Nocardioides sp. cx-173]
MSGIAPTGRREARDGTSYVAYARTFAAPIEDVWAAVTEPDRLARWIGTWSGDPASGAVSFRMTAEGEDVAAETYRIEVCEPPRRLVTHSGGTGPEDPDGMVWQLELDLVESDGVTTLTFAQVMSDPAVAESVGPGWDYYLDRLVAAETGRDVAGVVWDDYYPGQAGFYRSAFS